MQEAGSKEERRVLFGACSEPSSKFTNQLSHSSSTEEAESMSDEDRNISLMCVPLCRNIK